MITMYVASITNNEPKILKDSWYKTPISTSEDLDYFETFEEARTWLQERAWIKLLQARSRTIRRSHDYDFVCNLTEEDIT